jgi:dethiobiotin synthetase
MGQGILITGTDTGVGKTVVACLLGKRLLREGVAVLPLKPVESGCAPGADGAPFPADAAMLRDAFAPGLSLSSVCLYPLSAVLSPHLAARVEGVSVDPVRIGLTIAGAVKAADVVLIEGAGGVTVELRERYSFADLAHDLSLPVLIVAGNRLGVLNHLQLTMRYLQSEAIPLFGVILNDVIPEAFPAREPNEAEVLRIAGRHYLGRVPYGAAVLPEEIFSRFRRALMENCK